MIGLNEWTCSTCAFVIVILYVLLNSILPGADQTITDHFSLSNLLEKEILWQSQLKNKLNMSSNEPYNASSSSGDGNLSSGRRWRSVREERQSTKDPSQRAGRVSWRQYHLQSRLELSFSSRCVQSCLVMRSSSIVSQSRCLSSRLLSRGQVGMQTLHTARARRWTLTRFSTLILGARLESRHLVWSV